jgi:hypothetical protein
VGSLSNETNVNPYLEARGLPNDHSGVFSGVQSTLGWRSWLRHCTTSRKVAGSISDGVIGIFNLHNPSGRTTALGLTQPLTEVSTRNVFWA